MKIGKKHIIVTVLSLVGVILSAPTVFSAKKGATSREKARYYFAAGARQDAESNADAALHLYKKAYESDPSYVEAAYHYGRKRLMVSADTFQTTTEIVRSFEMMKPYIDAYPEDNEENIYYGYAAGKLDSVREAERVLNRIFEIDNKKNSGALIVLSGVHADHSELQKAADDLTRYEKVEGKNVQISYRKIYYYLNAGDTASAIEESNQLIESNPADASYRVLKGNLYEAIQQKDSAMQYYQLAEKMDPAAGEPKLALAEMYRENGDSVAYDNKIYELLLSEDFQVEEKTELLAQYLQILIRDNNDMSRGDYLFSVLSEQYPHDASLLDLSARYSAAKRDYKKAEEQISYALDMQPDNNIFWGQLMTYQAGDDRPEEALQTYDKALEHITPDKSLKNLYAMFALQAKDYPKVVKMYTTCITDIDSTLRTDTLISLSDLRKDITLDELDELSYYYASLGDACHQAGDNERAFMLYDNAVLLNPDNAMAYNNHAYFLCLDGGDLDKAESLVRKALNGKGKDNATYMDTLAWILYLKGNSEEAEAVQSKAVESMENEGYSSSEVYDHYGDILLKNGKTAEALEAWKKALDAGADDAEKIEEKLNKLSSVVLSKESDDKKVDTNE